MAQEQKTIGNQACEKGIKLWLFNIDHLKFFILAAEMGDLSGKVLAGCFDKNHYLLQTDLVEIQDRAKSSNATPEDKRNLALCYIYKFLPAQETEIQSLIKATANEGDPVILQLIAEGTFTWLTLFTVPFIHNPDFESMSDLVLKWGYYLFYGSGIKAELYHYLKKASDIGSLIATEKLYSCIETNMKELITYKYRRDHLQKEAKIFTSKTSNIDKLTHDLLERRLLEFVLCAESLPLEVIEIIEREKRAISSGRYPTHNFFESFRKSLAQSSSSTESSQQKTHNADNANPRPGS